MLFKYVYVLCLISDPFLVNIRTWEERLSAAMLNPCTWTSCSQGVTASHVSWNTASWEVGHIAHTHMDIQSLSVSVCFRLSVRPSISLSLRLCLCLCLYLSGSLPLLFTSVLSSVSPAPQCLHKWYIHFHLPFPIINTSAPLSHFTSKSKAKSLSFKVLLLKGQYQHPHLINHIVD